MSKNLVIVESPAKAKTISRYLGRDFEVVSSFGHIRDLPKSEMGVDTEGDFDPRYVIPTDKRKVITSLKKAAKGSEVWLASDEDREGEAIAWHLAQALDLDPKTTKRIVFHEITKEALLEAVSKPRTINMDLVDAQQARRVLDRLVGYEISPLLWKKVRRGLSAGRVQSVAVRLIVEREEEIKNHKSQPEFSLNFEFAIESATIAAKLSTKLGNEDEASKTLLAFATGPNQVDKITTRTSKRNPGAPFTTSSLQQEASSRLGYGVKRTMQLAQRLYEAGHITYMRTDSVNLSDTALNTAAQVIKKDYGDKYYNRRTYKSKSKGAQEAHEAIRPTSLEKSIAGADPQQEKLYQLIRQRTLASQMKAAEIETRKLEISCPDTKHTAVADSQHVLFDGFLVLGGHNYKSQDVGSINEGHSADFVSGIAEEARSKPPARYTEASLVKELEKRGIGRPSTYAPTIGTIIDRGYVAKGEGRTQNADLMTLTVAAKDPKKVVKVVEDKAFLNDKGRLIATDIGELVNGYLVKAFSEILDYEFTANVEEKFDHISTGDLEWKKYIKDFYGHFHPFVTQAADSKDDIKDSRIELGPHPKTGEPVFVRYARFGPVFQIGEAVKDGPKPVFVNLPPGIKISDATMEDLKSMEQLPVTIGDYKEKPIISNFGPYGPYVKYDSKFVSIGDLDPRFITLDQAIDILKRDAEQPTSGVIKEWDNLIVKNGRFGPYVTDGSINATIPKSMDANEITETEAKELIAKKAARGSSKKGHKTPARRGSKAKKARKKTSTKAKK